MRRVLIVVAVLTGCSGAPLLPGVTPYRIDVQQGNYVTQDMVAKLKPGMTRAQVRFALGTPLVVDTFRNDRWDYIYVYKKGGQTVEQRHMSVFFKGDQLVRVDGDVAPAPAHAPATKPNPAASAAKSEAGAQTSAGVATPDADKAGPTAAGSGTEQPQPQQEEKGFFGRMLERLGF